MKKNKANKVVSAILKKDIYYLKKGIKKPVAKNTKILVDVDSSIALIDGDHVDIFHDEYQLLGAA